MSPAPSNVIILNNEGIVNIEISEKKIVSHETCDISAKFSDKMQKITQKKEHSIAISKKLIAIGERNRGLRMKACNTEIQLYRCKCCGKTKILNAHLCRDRLCPTCQYLLSVKRYNQMIKTIDNIENIGAYDWRFVTLTIRNCYPEKLEDTISKMLKAWDKFCKRRLIKRILSGAARSLEITYNKASGQFHPHLHILCAFKKNSALSLRELSEFWQESLNIDYLPECDIKEPYSKTDDKISAAVIECFKYATKSKEVAEMPLSSFAFLVNALRGCRLLSFCGIIREARKKIGIIENDEAEQEVLDSDMCCGAKMQKAIAKWSFSENNYNVIMESIGDE